MNVLMPSSPTEQMHYHKMSFITSKEPRNVPRGQTLVSLQFAHSVMPIWLFFITHHNLILSNLPTDRTCGFDGLWVIGILLPEGLNACA